MSKWFSGKLWQVSIKEKKMEGYADLADLSEDDRIAIIGRTAESGKRVAFIVEDDAKADRYIEKLTRQYRVSVAKRLDGPVKDTVTIIVTRGRDTGF
jgi:hypothetical protein